jgi:steroid 5-alpha reductase family enzyme
MALPAVRTLTECADFTQTVSPYLYQLYDLPQQVLQSYSNTAELRNIYLSTNPVISGLAFSLLLAPIFLVVSEVNRNYSQVDRCWSILPTLYNAHFAIYARMSGIPTQRLNYLLAFSVAWSVCYLKYPTL